MTSVDAAAILHQVAVLMEAGITPGQAWTYASGGANDAPPNSDDADTDKSAATDVWADVGVAWRVAREVGAPLAPTLRGLSSAIRDAEQSRDDVRVALAEPRATARLVAWLPAVGVLLAVALGFDPLRTVSSPLGLACLVAGAVLMLIAHLWTRSLLCKAQPEPGLAGLDADILAIALSGGASLDRAVQVVAASGGREISAPSRAILDLSRHAGAPAVDLLRASADDQRHRARTLGRLTAARLSTRLLLPLGACTLPSFLLIGVAPMLLSIVSENPVPL